MGNYDNHLVGGAALEKVLQLLKADQQRQDTNIGDVEASLPTSLDATDIAEIWNEVFNN